MQSLKLEKDGNLFLLEMISGETGNTFTPENVLEWKEILRELQGQMGSSALVIHSQHKKFFHTGLDLDFLSDKGTSWVQQNFLPGVDNILGRLAALPMPTVAAINGHTYGAGAFLAMACDFRFMRDDRAYFCLPEINVGITLGESMQKLITSLPDQRAAKELLLTGRPVDASEAARMKIIDRACDRNKVLKRATELASSLMKKDRNTYASLKRSLNPSFVNTSSLYGRRYQNTVSQMAG